MDDFIQRIKQNRLFILGAGFSASAGIPMIGQLLFDSMQLFVRQLRKYDILISFNWDPLLEVALRKVGKTFSYNNYVKADVRIYKFHGSVNWRLNNPGRARFVWKPFEFTKGIMAEELYYC